MKGFTSLIVLYIKVETRIKYKSKYKSKINPIFKSMKNKIITSTLLASALGLAAMYAAPLMVSADNPVPTTTSISPPSVAKDSGAFTLTVNGTNFLNNSSVNVNGSPRATTYVSATQLTA